METKPKRYQYEVGVRWSGEKRGGLSAAGKPGLEVASPPEFRGHPGIWSPEDLFVAAVNSCTMTTFLSAARRHLVDLVSYECSAIGTLETVDGQLRFTEVVLKPRIVVAREDQLDAARAAFHEAEAGCLIAKSIRAWVEAEPEIRVLATHLVEAVR